MEMKQLRRHLFCNVELNYYTDGAMALECNDCGKTVLLFCASTCGAVAVKDIAIEILGARKKRKKKKNKKRSKEFQAKVKAICEYHNNNRPKPLQFED